jgi:hypothetical protein
MVTTLKNSSPVARKQHICDFCYGKIKPGTKYNRSTIVNDHIFEWKSHQHCDDISIELRMYKDTGPDGLGPDEFQDIIREKYNELKPDPEENPSFNQILKIVCNKYLK